MAIYYSCNCGNSKEGDEIYRCKKCGRGFCRNCSDWAGIILTGARWCPNCGETCFSIGRIESESEEEEEEEEEKGEEEEEYEEDDSEDYSSYDVEQEILAYFPQMREYLEKPREKQSSEVLDMMAKGLFDLNWSKYPEAESLYYMIRPRPTHSSSLNLNDELNDGMKTGFNFLFFLFSIFFIGAIIINAVEKHNSTNQESVALLNVADKPVNKEKLADNIKTATRENEAAADIEESVAIDSTTTEAPPVLSAPAQDALSGTVEYTESVNLHIRTGGDGYAEPVDPYIVSTGEKIIPGLRIFVRLDNGHKAVVILDYNENFNPKERVNVISRDNESDGTVEYARYDYLESVGERMIDSEIAIKLDNGGRTVVVLPDQEEIFNKGERVRTISRTIK